MSIAQIKNFSRRLDNLSNEAASELDKICGHSLWRNIGFDAIDGLEDNESRSTANYYFGQWQTARELQEFLS